jgi:hypothetical protein
MSSSTYNIAYSEDIYCPRIDNIEGREWEALLFCCCPPDIMIEHRHSQSLTSNREKDLKKTGSNMVKKLYKNLHACRLKKKTKALGRLLINPSYSIFHFHLFFSL